MYRRKSDFLAVRRMRACSCSVRFLMIARTSSCVNSSLRTRSWSSGSDYKDIRYVMLKRTCSSRNWTVSVIVLASRSSVNVFWFLFFCWRSEFDRLSNSLDKIITLASDSLWSQNQTRIFRRLSHRDSRHIWICKRIHCHHGQISLWIRQEFRERWLSPSKYLDHSPSRRQRLPRVFIPYNHKKTDN